MKKFIVIFIHLLFIFNLYSGDPGSKSMTFLNIAPNPRVAALGESFTAVANDASSVYWNPAGLNTLNNMEAIINYNVYLESIALFNLMFAKNFGFGGIGLNVTALNYGSIDNYVDGTLSGSISPGAFLISVGYGKEIIYNLFLGASVKYISETLTDEYSGSGIGFDLGILYKNPLGILIKRNFIKPLNFGINVQNIGIGPKYSDNNNSLPVNLKFGFSYKLRFAHSVAKLKDINFMLDFTLPGDSSFGIRYGTELWWYNIGNIIDASLRVGLKAPQDLGFITGLTFGAGIRIMGIEVDYALVNYGDLGITHRLGLDYKFGTIIKPKEIFIAKPEKTKNEIKNNSKSEKKKSELKKSEEELDEENIDDNSDIDVEEDLDLEE